MPFSQISIDLSFCFCGLIFTICFGTAGVDYIRACGGKFTEQGVTSNDWNGCSNSALSRMFGDCRGFKRRRNLRCNGLSGSGSIRYWVCWTGIIKPKICKRWISKTDNWKQDTLYMSLLMSASFGPGYGHRISKLMELHLVIVEFYQEKFFTQHISSTKLR